jgi:signal transduction histidine kinase
MTPRGWRDGVKTRHFTKTLPPPTRRRPQADDTVIDIRAGAEALADDTVVEIPAEARAHQQARQLREMASRLTQAEQRERRRLAHLLHDHFQQLLVAARMKIGLLRYETEETGILDPLQQIDHLLVQAIDEARSLTLELSPPVLHDAGLAAALHWLAAQMKRKHGLTVEVDADPDSEPAESDTRAFLFRTVQELLLNVVKHAHTSGAKVVLAMSEPRLLRIVVSDAGAGFDMLRKTSRNAHGFGLWSIRQYLECLGGRLEVVSVPGKGTRVTLLVPQ